MDKEVELNHCSRTAEVIYRLGHDSISLMKWIVCYDNQHENNKSLDLMASTLTVSNQNECNIPTVNLMWR